MKKSLLTFFLLLPFILLSCNREQKSTSPQTTAQPPKKEAPVEVPSFDGLGAFGYLLKQTNFGPRVVGTASHTQCLAFFKQELQTLADTVWLQPFTEKGYDNKILYMNNVIASYNVKATKRVLLLAHWDSRPWADQDKDPKKRSQPVLGANDGASGVAVLLEIAKVLKSNPPPIGVDILLVDGEDYGKEGDDHYYLLGSRYFSKNLPRGYSPAFAILLDMVGDSQLEIKKESFSLGYAPDIVELVWSAAYSIGVPQFTDLIETKLGSDDHIPLNEVGIKTIDIIDFSYPNSTENYWHTTLDTPDHCSAESLEAIGKVLLQVLFTQTP